MFSLSSSTATVDLTCVRRPACAVRLPAARSCVGRRRLRTALETTRFSERRIVANLHRQASAVPMTPAKRACGCGLLPLIAAFIAVRTPFQTLPRRSDALRSPPSGNIRQRCCDSGAIHTSSLLLSQASPRIAWTTPVRHCCHSHSVGSVISRFNLALSQRQYAVARATRRCR